VGDPLDSLPMDEVGDHAILLLLSLS
jgi:hypothetical protein